MKTNNRGKFFLRLTKVEISILKAALEYYELDNDFGYVVWSTIPCATAESNGFRFQANLIYQKLNNLSKIEPNFGEWGDIEGLVKFCRKEYRKAKRAGRKAQKRLNDGQSWDESMDAYSGIATYYGKKRTIEGQDKDGRVLITGNKKLLGVGYG